MQLIGILILFGTVVLAAWSIARPPWAFALLSLMFPLKQVLQGYLPQLVPYGPHMSAGFAAIAAMAVFMKATRQKLTVATFFNPVTFCTLGIYALMLFGMLYTPAREQAMSMLKDGFPYIIVFLFIYPFLLSSLDELRQGIFLTVLLGSIMTVCFFFNPSAQWTGGRLVINLGLKFGVMDFTSNPLALADTGGMMMIFAALMNFKDKGKLGIVFTVAGLVLGLGLAIVSGSRGQIIFAVVVSVLMYPIARQIKDVKQFLLVAAGTGFMALIVFATFSFFLEGEALRRWSFNLVQEGTTDRQQRVLEAIGYYFSRPAGWILGNGTNSFAYFKSAAFEYPHNIIAELLLDYGIVGLSLGLMAGYFTFKNARQMIRIWGDDPVARGTVAAWIGICLFALLTAFKQGSVIGQPVPFYFWIVLAKILGDELKAAGYHEDLYVEPVQYEYEELAAGYGEPERT